MRKPLIFFLVSLSLFTGCGKKDKPPGSILQQEKMENVLWDMMRADQFLLTYVLSKDTTKKKETESRKLYSQIFQLHTITEKQFSESFSWYKAHPVLLAVIMDSISKKTTSLTDPLPAPINDGDSKPQAVPALPDKARKDSLGPTRPRKIKEID